MKIAEHTDYKIGSSILAAFGYESLNKRKVWVKISGTHYQLQSGKKIAHYKSLQTTGNALSNEKV